MGMEHKIAARKRGRFLLYQCIAYAVVFGCVLVYENGFLGFLGGAEASTSHHEGQTQHFHLRKLTADPPRRLGTADYWPDPLLGEPTYEDIDGKWRIICHILGIFYMFAALSIVVDEYFCAALTAMVDTWKIKEDVAGATFMAAGGSAPELFTSIMGVFVSKSDVGFGTIIGSAVFNVLFVIGLCAVFAKEVLALTWWPLFRDCTYYILGLCTLAAFVANEEVTWYEALVLFCMYVLYCTIMYHNEALEARVEGLAARLRGAAPIGPTAAAEAGAEERAAAALGRSPRAQLPSDPRDSSKAPIGSSLDVSTKYLDSSVRSMRVESISSDSKATRKVQPYEGSGSAPASARGRAGSRRGPGHRLASGSQEPSFRRAAREARRDSQVCFALEVRSQTIKALRRGSYGGEAQSNLEEKLRALEIKAPREARAALVDEIAELAQRSVEMGKVAAAPPPAPAQAGPDAAAGRPVAASPAPAAPEQVKVRDEDEKSRVSEQGLLEEREGDGDDGGPFEVPAGAKERALWVVTLPLVAAMHFTIPNCEKPRWERYFLLTFGISLVWIALFSYLLVWWCSIVGEVLGWSDVVMGLTILAAGTSIPDALSSVIMARMGQGDMAVSSSIGSNVFDILVGLPVPWFIYTAMYKPGDVVTVQSPYLVVHTALLLFMVFAVIVSIMLRKWRLDMVLGAIMGSLYFVFLICAVFLETQQPSWAVI